MKVRLIEDIHKPAWVGEIDKGRTMPFTLMFRGDVYHHHCWRDGVAWYVRPRASSQIVHVADDALERSR